MRKLIVLCLTLLMCGCSCSTQNPSPTPTPSPTPSATPTASPESMNGNAKGVMDYLSKNYTLTNPSPINNLDGNAMEGYTFGYDSADYYLLRFDRNNGTASQWLDEANKNGYIEVKINDQLKKYYAVVNQDYMLLYETEHLDSGFKEYFQNYSYHNPSDPSTN